MGGKHSRRKGARVELLLVKELNSLGFRDARRLYTLGWKGKAQQGGITKGGDVIAGPPGDPKEIIFEVKARGPKVTTFGLTYALIDANKKEAMGVWDETGNVGFYCSYCLYDLLPGGGNKQMVNETEFEEKNAKRAIKAVFKMREWLGEAAILVIKQDHKPFLYIRYYL